MGRYESCEHFEAVYQAGSDCFPSLDEVHIHTIIRELILAPEDYMVEFNDGNYNKKQLFSKIGQILKQNCISDSLQKTYQSHIESVAEIIKHMNDGYISEQDYQERNDYMQFAGKCEFMLFTSLAMLKTAEDEDTSFEELCLNIIRLRETQDLIFKYTRDAENVEVSREEYERAKPIYKMLKSLQGLGYNYTFSAKERTGLGIDHSDDGDLTSSFNYYNWLKRIMLLQLRIETSGVQAISPAQTSHINKNYEEQYERIAQLRGTINQRRFDRDRFLMLKDEINTEDKPDY